MNNAERAAFIRGFEVAQRMAASHCDFLKEEPTEDPVWVDACHECGERIRGLKAPVRQKQDALFGDGHPRVQPVRHVSDD